MQNLAYLGHDNKVHHVGKITNGKLGASAPMNLMSIKEHAAAENRVFKQQAVARAAQAEWVKTHGLSAKERKLIAHAAAEKKILDLQKLGYLGSDGAYHRNEMLGGIGPMHLRSRSHSHDKKKIPLEIHAAAEKKELKKQAVERANRAKYLKEKKSKDSHKKALKKHARAEAKILK
jgi:hypothetical protein